MMVRMAILPEASPLSSEIQPTVAPAPKPTPRSAPTPLPAPIPPVREPPPPEETLPSEETASVASVASTAPETPVAERALATVDSERASYVDRIRAQVEARKRYPSMARRRGTEGVVLARFHLDEEGKVISIWTDNAAASILSRSAREAVERAAPFPPPPHGSIVIEIPIRYALRQ